MVFSSIIIFEKHWSFRPTKQCSILYNGLCEFSLTISLIPSVIYTLNCYHNPWTNLLPNHFDASKIKINNKILKLTFLSSMLVLPFHLLFLISFSRSKRLHILTKTETRDDKIFPSPCISEILTEHLMGSWLDIEL